MNIVLIGSGGREHALAMALANSPSAEKITVIPGNPGMLMHEKISISKTPIIEFVQTNKVELVIIGPEAPLAQGLSDELRSMGLNVFGPTKSAAKLESSKIFAKEIMSAANVPTAKYSIAMNFDEAKQAIGTICDESGVVLKADGLASGKGVVVCDDATQAIAAAKELLNKYDGPLLIEKKVFGREMSALYLCLDEFSVCLGSACDHKRLLDNDQGPNTGGMGTYSPVPWLTNKLNHRIQDEVITPVLRKMKENGTPFSGMLFAGLMIDGEELNVLEFNVRFGDPETQAILPRIEWDAAEVLYSIAISDRERFLSSTIKQKMMSCVHVVKASAGYPEKPQLGKPIKVGEVLADSQLYFAGVELEDGKLLTSGGRVLGVSALADNLGLARNKAYACLENINFEGAIYRRDIGAGHD